MSRFPLHAAGEHLGNSKRNTISCVISSYTPTLKALQYSREKERLVASSERKMLIATMPNTPGLPDLDVGVEVEGIRKAIGKSFNINVMENPSGNDVIEVLEDVTIAHFSCHGITNAADPSASKLVLYNATTKEADPLQISDIVLTRMRNAQLAYLSACSTAENSSGALSEETIHLCSSFQAVGFPHVVGTMWEAWSDSAETVAVDFYDSLISYIQDGKGDSLKAAEALHCAVSRLREEYPEDVLAWAPFIHMGA
jgi:CHAT domain-containing protein